MRWIIVLPRYKNDGSSRCTHSYSSSFWQTPLEELMILVRWPNADWRPYLKLHREVLWLAKERNPGVRFPDMSRVYDLELLSDCIRRAASSWTDITKREHTFRLVGPRLRHQTETKCLRKTFGKHQLWNEHSKAEAICSSHHITGLRSGRNFVHKQYGSRNPGRPATNSQLRGRCNVWWLTSLKAGLLAAD